MKKNLILTMILLLAVNCGFAEVKMTSLFADNMIFQRDAKVNIWGFANPNSKVVVEFAKQEKSVKADNNGRWNLQLDELKTSAKGRDMKIYEDGKLSKTIKNILVGEVWILAGQSNMGLQVRWTVGYEDLSKNADYPLIRYFDQNIQIRQLKKKPVELEKEGEWLVCAPENVSRFSSVGAQFGINLYKDLNIPIGLVFAARGGCAMRCLIPEERMGELEYTKKMYADFLEKNATYDYPKVLKAYEDSYAAWEKQRDELMAAKKPVPRRPFPPQEHSYLDIHNTPVYLYNMLISHLGSFTAQGVVWYQGESDSGGPSLENFVKQFALVVDCWREQFKNEDLEFIITQLPSIGGANTSENLPNTRWAQYECAQEIPGCFISNNIDQGEADVHYKDKREVGRRLEKIALREIYGKKDVKPYGAIFSGAEYDYDKVTLSFDLDGENLKGKGLPRGFEVLVKDKWVEGDAEIIGNKVCVNSIIGEEVMGVRYLWYNFPRVNSWLYSTNDLPALSFCDRKDRSRL